MSVRIQLISDWRKGWDDEKDFFPAGTRLSVDDDQAKELIELGAARVLDEDETKDPEYVPTGPTASNLVGSAGQAGVQQPVPQVTPAGPTQEQIQAELDKAGLGQADPNEGAQTL